ncbi:MAG: acetate--CoA ligase alpha subunit [Candidatus Ranarchaeia archaeon]
MNLLKPLTNPKSVAIIGASRTTGSVGNSVLKNMINSGFKGKIFPINPKSPNILGLKAYKSVLDIKDSIDLAVFCIPARIVISVLQQCVKKKVKSICIISAGFKEVGQKGAELEKKVVDICRENNIPMLGPNVLGIINTHVPFNASFAPMTPLKGSIAFISQSGALHAGILDWSISEGIGFSQFISLGNKADLDESDFIKSLGEDRKTKVILAYLESVKNGERFINVTKEVSREKPVIILKGGRSSEGARAASSHTGSLAGQFVAYETAFKQSGAVPADNIQELFDLALVFSTQKIPKGKRVAIITNAGGPGILTTDSIISNGLEMARFTEETIKKLKRKLPPTANFYNPVDLIGDAQADRYEYALNTIVKDPNVDSVVVLLTMQAPTEPIKTARAIINVKKRNPKIPIISVFIGGQKINKANDILNRAKVPCFDFPDRAIKALAMLNGYGDFLENHSTKTTIHEDVDKLKVRAIFEGVYSEQRTNLLASESFETLRAYGIKTPISKLAKNEKEAVEHARVIGYPLVMRIASPDILHKSDIGGVILNLRNEDEVNQAYHRIIENTNKFMPKANIYGVTINYMEPLGRELIVGMSQDVQFGPLLMFGLGGIYVNFLKDVSFCLAPCTDQDIDKMINATKASTLLKGIRGEAPADVEAIKDTIQRISQLVRDFKEIVELDINPLFVYEENKGINAVDVKITLYPRKEKIDKN